MKIKISITFLVMLAMAIGKIKEKKIERIIDRLDASIRLNDMNLPGYNLHPLIGKEKEGGQSG